MVGHGDDGGAAGLGEADILHDAIGEASGEGDLLARGRAVDVAFEVGGEPDRQFGRGRGVDVELEFGCPCGSELATLSGQGVRRWPENERAGEDIPLSI